MQLRQLETFIAIAECGTLTAAARKCYKTQGAISRDLRLLEQEFGVLLIDRSGQRIRLTPAGAALLPHCIELLRRADDIRDEAIRVRSGGSSVIRVGAPPTLTSSLLGQVLSFRRTTPEAQFVLFTELQGTLVEWLLDGRLDLAVANPDLRSELSCVPLGGEEVLIVLRNDHPLAGAEQLTPEDLEGQPFIGGIRELSSTPVAERFFTPAGEYPTPVVEVDDFRLMKELVARDVGFAIMPRSALDEGDELIGVRADPPLQRDIAVLVRRSRLLPPAAVAFQEALVDSWSTLAHLRPRTGRQKRVA
jgi:DNA-binding transcriptional LysR family regulator